MFQRLTGQLPAWMLPDHPILRYTLGRNREEKSRRRRLSNLAGLVAVLVAFVIGGYFVSSEQFTVNPFDQPLSQMLFNILFWPTLILQVVLQIAAQTMTINTIGEEKRRQTWDSLKTTSQGAALTVRTRWSAVLFYRLRGFIAILLAVRIILIGALLFDLTAFRGEYLNYLTGSITPSIPLPLAVLLLAVMMAATLLLPITGLGIDAASGLLVSTFAQQRTYTVLVQVVITALRVAIIVGLLFTVTQFRTGELEASALVTWLLLFFFAAMGDWGLSFLWLGFYGSQVWAEVPYGIFIGLAVLLYVMVQAALTDGLMNLAIRRADGTER